MQLYYNFLMCTDEGMLLSYQFCATMQDNKDVFIEECPYFQLDGHDIASISEPGYIKLPENILALNDSSIGPVHCPYH